MKTIKLLVECVAVKIKKKFFKEQKADFNHACEKLKNNTKKAETIEERKQIEEYALSYAATTRWQTI